MRIALSFILLGALTALGLEIIVSDKKRTEMSASVFTGTVTNVQHLPLVGSNSVAGGLGPGIYDRGLWRAEIVVESVTKQDVPIGKVAVVYYEQRPVSLDGRASFAGRVCPGYPAIETNLHATFWCHRVTMDDLTNVLYVSMPSWIKSQ